MAGCAPTQINRCEREKELLKALKSHGMFIFGLNFFFLVSKCLCPKGNITFLTAIYVLELEVVEIYFNRNKRH